MRTAFNDVIDDLVAEYERLSSILCALTDEQWELPSAAAGWTIADTVLHLAMSEEGVATTLAMPEDSWHVRDHALDDAMDAQVRATTSTTGEILDRWQNARHGSVRALRVADPKVKVRWAAAPLRPQTLATTRMAEHWAHALDIVEPLGLTLPDEDRLRHIAWLGHSTLPYAFRLHDQEPADIFCTLTKPDGSVMHLGPPEAASTVTGPIGDFCRTGAQRLRPEHSSLQTRGPRADDALRVLRNYAA